MSFTLPSKWQFWNSALLSFNDFFLSHFFCLALILVWGIKLEKVDLSWPSIFSKYYNPSWIELTFFSNPLNWVDPNFTYLAQTCRNPNWTYQFKSETAGAWTVYSFQKFQNAVFLEIFQIPSSEWLKLL